MVSEPSHEFPRRPLAHHILVRIFSSHVTQMGREPPTESRSRAGTFWTCGVVGSILGKYNPVYLLSYVSSAEADAATATSCHFPCLAPDPHQKIYLARLLSSPPSARPFSKARRKDCWVVCFRATFGGRTVHLLLFHSRVLQPN